MSNLAENTEIVAELEKDQLSNVDTFPDFDSINHGDLLGLSLSTNTTPLTHGMHRFAAKYIPQVPRWAISQFCDEHSVVVDPFMGSGTTLVESLQSVKSAYGLDIDPLAKLITKAKINPYNIDNIQSLTKKILKHKGKRSEGDELPMSGVKNPLHWFSKENKEKLNFIFEKINSFQTSQSEKEFFLCVFSSVLRWVSNADDQSQKTYVSGTLKKSPPDAWEVFERFVGRSIQGIKELDSTRNQVSQARILDGDALSMPLSNNSVDLIVTSPPYVDSVDYMYNFMLEYFWLGPSLGVESRSKFNEMRRQSVGSKNPSIKNEMPPAAISKMVCPSEIPNYRKSAVIGYFHGMEEHFKEASRVLKPNARYVLVVGNSQSANGIMPVHDCLTKLAAQYDLKLEKAFAYRIRRHYMKFPRKGRGGIILMDWIIVLKKTKKSLGHESQPLPIPNIKIGAHEVAH
ncbi:MAG: DNA methyltransferase [Candidatus Thiodiazotropha taylori]|uniref:site-specific DNA-methyltransferase (cytosine-N(4)-specific) n=1 Tax=Candidatus Thiodiazotropha taylori TaxID=2792791 RepID=A0A9E4KE36_9GAMM|nr:modification methylase [Candidatus Thiodiazotropha taylori]MCW4257519.1 DNA methyltransferase [Candidatus Thiodiazotropha taylori]